MPTVFHNKRGDPKRIYDRLRLTTSRLAVYVWPADASAPLRGFGFISDISQVGLGVYIGRRLPPGSPVHVAFEREDAPTHRGQIMWCTRFSLESGFFGQNVVDHHAGVKFHFSSEAERQRYLAFFEETRRQVLQIKGKMTF